MEAAWRACKTDGERWELLTGLGPGGVGACFARSGGAVMDGELAGSMLKCVVAMMESDAEGAATVCEGLAGAPSWADVTLAMLDEEGRASAASAAKGLRDLVGRDDVLKLPFV